MALMWALAALEVAENHFNWAEPEYIGAALYEVRAAEEALAAEIKEAKHENFDQEAGSEVPADEL